MAASATSGRPSPTTALPGPTLPGPRRTYTVPGQTTTTLYRARVSCLASAPDGHFHCRHRYHLGPHLCHAADACRASKTPGWTCATPATPPPTAGATAPATGNNSWRRDDDGASAAWTTPTTGGLHAGQQPGHALGPLPQLPCCQRRIVGTLDLYVNLSAGRRQAPELRLHQYQRHRLAAGAAVHRRRRHFHAGWPAMSSAPPSPRRCCPSAPRRPRR